MIERAPCIDAVLAARQDGRYADALRQLQALFADTRVPITLAAPQYFSTMLEWRFLYELYPPAGDALRAERAEQIGHLLRGDAHFGAPHASYGDGRVMHTSRFSVIVHINEILADPQSTSALFIALDATQPALACDAAQRALPALVATGAFALADRYRGDPLRHLAHFNDEARRWPLFPPGREAPRVAANLMGLVGDVHVAMAVLSGLGAAAAAQALRAALLAGLEGIDARALAQRDLDTPGAIRRELVAHQMARDGHAP